MVHPHQCSNRRPTDLSERVPHGICPLRFRLLRTLVVATCVTSCGGGSSGSTTSHSAPSPATTFQDTVAGTAGQTGTLAITVQTAVASSAPFSFPFVATLHAQAVNAAGTLRLVGGSNIALAGTFESAGKQVSVSGGGFTFLGTMSGEVASGTWTGPNNTAGRFSSLNATSSTVTAHCGTFTNTLREGGESGLFRHRQAERLPAPRGLRAMRRFARSQAN